MSLSGESSSSFAVFAVRALTRPYFKALLTRKREQASERESARARERERERERESERVSEREREKVRE